MKSFSNIFESQDNNSYEITSKELSDYIDKGSKLLPQSVKNALYIIKTYEIYDGDDILKLSSSNKSSSGSVIKKYNISPNDAEDLKSILKGLKNNINLLPQFLTQKERMDFIKGKLRITDLTIDLNTPNGRNEATKLYMPLVYKIVNQYVGKSNLSRQDLISAALIGFTNAMNQWDKSKGSIFKSYAAYRVKQQILNDINEYSHTLSGTNWYATKKFGASLLDATSIDRMPRDEEGEFDQSRLASLGVEDSDWTLNRDEKSQWKKLYDIIERKFKQRDLDIFYRYFGLNGYKREKSKDIAKSYGMSEGNIRNSVLNKIISYLKTDKNAMEILSDIQDLYNESLMVDLIGCDYSYIKECLSNDDIYILLEEVNRWNNKTVFINAFNNAIINFSDKDKYFINEMMESDFETIDSVFKKNKKLIILFLSNMYPTESMVRKSDVSLLEYILDIQRYYKKFILQ